MVPRQEQPPAAEIMNRRSNQAGQLPTPMMQAVSGVEKWKLNVMFVVGLAGMGGLVYWFVFGDRGRDHSTPEFVMAGIMFVVSAFFAFPIGVTRFADKFWPNKWRRDRRDKRSPGVRP
ncbi:hypothetical protein LCGC14_2112720 [marine sediment metagenome]|uniref:Uncharacterized protein n=1 Tax=marine sediment metagenome TaxID=412755 RepID=A0A0F9E6J8_9ZZZZ